MKTELEYWKDLAINAVDGYYELRKSVLQTANEKAPISQAQLDAAAVCNVSADEIYDILGSDTYGAYAKYCENNPPLHEYIVSFELPAFTGTVRVKAKNEDEAEDYVLSNIVTEEIEVGMVDNEYLIGDPELDCDYGNAIINNIEDNGEYEE